MFEFLNIQVDTGFGILNFIKYFGVNYLIIFAIMLSIYFRLVFIEYINYPIYLLSFTYPFLDSQRDIYQFI